MSTPTPDYGEPWRVDSARGVMDKNNDAICYPVGTARFERIMAERIADCVNACAGMTDPAAEIAELRHERDEAREENARLREVVKDARDCILRLLDNGHDDGCAWINYANAACTCGVEGGHTLLGKLQPFLTQ